MTESSLTSVAPAIASSVERLMRRVEDFPSAGVQFCDLTPVLADSEGFDAVVTGLCAGHEVGTVDYVAGLDARGFLLAGAVAMRLHTGVLAIRKAGKLPPPVHSRSYELEYGAATLELPAESVLTVTADRLSRWTRSGGQACPRRRRRPRDGRDARCCGWSPRRLRCHRRWPFGRPRGPGPGR